MISASPTAPKNKVSFLSIEPILFLLLIVLSMVGVVILYSASGSSHAMITKQIIRLIIAFSIMIFFAQIPAHRYRQWTPFFFYGCVALLLGVLLVGKIGKGAQRWLDFGLFRFQPSELMKILLPMMLAWFFSKYEQFPASMKSLAASALLILIPGFLIAKQPDLGTALMVIFSGCAIIFFVGMSYRLILSLSVSVCLAMPFIWHHLHQYQKLRVLNFIQPERDPLGSGYHIIQSKIAIGSGGLWGKGFLNGTQSHLHFLPEHTTDFIFAVFGEEFGLVGCLALILLFAAIVGRCLQMAYRTHHTFSKLVMVGLSCNFFLSAFVNMGMVSGILPVVGVPLPLISYGGSSMLVLLASFGVIMALYADHRLFK